MSDTFSDSLYTDSKSNNDVVCETPYFQNRLQKVDQFGNPGARLCLRIGGNADSHDIQYDAGPVFFSSYDFAGFLIVDLKFPEGSQSFRRSFEMLESYMKRVDTTTGEIDPDYVFSAVFTENSAERTGYLVANIPVFFAQTSSTFCGPIDTLRIAFRRDYVVEATYDYDGEEYGDEQAAEEPDEPSGTYWQ